MKRMNEFTVMAFLYRCLFPYSVLLCLLLGGLFALPANPVLAQGNRLLPTSDHAYEYIVRLQRRGHLLDLNPTSLPYREKGGLGMR